VIVNNAPRERCGRSGIGFIDVKLYDFEVLKGDGVVSARRAVAIRDLKDAWPMITEMALATIEAGCRIRVTDETGAIVILTGVVAARRHAETDIAA
jgi:hypothetical protein